MTKASIIKINKIFTFQELPYQPYQGCIEREKKNKRKIENNKLEQKGNKIFLTFQLI